jgi:chromosome partitioning protein
MIAKGKSISHLKASIHYALRAGEAVILDKNIASQDPGQVAAEYFSYEGLRNFAAYIDELKEVAPNLELGGIFATRFNPNKRLNKEIIKSVKDNLRSKILNTHIRENIALTAAQAKGMHIFEYDKQSNGAKDYHTLTKEIWETINR